jgi:transcriptional regulator with XRE-family HTH domain
MADQQPEPARWFGRRLRELREAAGLTQQALAERVGVKWETISRWERGDREPNWSNILGLAQALGVDCTAFTQPPATEQPEPKRGRPRKAQGPAQPTEDTTRAVEGDPVAGSQGEAGTRKAKPRMKEK